jgi:hypothetical protein
MILFPIGCFVTSYPCIAPIYLVVWLEGRGIFLFPFLTMQVSVVEKNYVPFKKEMSVKASTNIA